MLHKYTKETYTVRNDCLQRTYHRGFHLDLSYDKIMKQKTIYHPSPFNRKLQSKCPPSIRFYKYSLENKVTTQRLESKV